MDLCLIVHARIFDTARLEFFRGALLIRQGRISALYREELPSLPMETIPPDAIYDAEGRMLVPGLVDVHTHGRAGGDFGTADLPLMERMAESYLQSGVTTLLPTLASAPMEELKAAIGRVNALRRIAAASEGRLPHVGGVHLEGRYLNAKRRGAHAAELLAKPEPRELSDLLSCVEGARHVTAAWELDETDEALACVLSLGATAALGHSDADYHRATSLMDKGVSALTHTFNALPPLHHRDGGAVAAGLLSPAVHCEMICDGFHIAPHMVSLAYRLARERLTLITDSMEATGCPDGEYSIAGNPVTVKDGKARTHDGAIAGSTLSLWEAVQKLQSFAGVSIEQAVYAATMAPALEVGLEREVGSLEPGKRADLLLLNDSATVGRVMCGGRWCT